MLFYSNVARMCGDYIRRVLDWQLDLLDHNTIHTYNRVFYNYNWLSQLSHNSWRLFRAQDLLQTQLALTGHQLTLLDSSPQLTVN
jgi:hypothetical protein